jgi:glycopeptide antibiotics resistance protein
MNWRKIWRIFGILYLFLYVMAMLLPRKLPSDQISSSNANFFKKVFSQLLYYGGPLEPVVNFFVLIPLFLFLLNFLDGNKAVIAVSICIGLSAISEILQRSILGRVSSIRDFALNSCGSIMAFLLFKIVSTRKIHPIN